MKIAVNVRFLIKDHLEGIGVFSFHTLKEITSLHPEHDFYFIFDRPYDQSFVFSKNIHPIVLFPPARHPFLWFIWYEMSIDKYLKKIKPDIFVSMDGFISLRSNCKQLAVVHDLAFESFPKDIPWLASKYYRYFFPKFVKKANRIATVSNFSKYDIIQKYDCQETKIDVVFNGASDIFKPINDGQKAFIKQRFTNGSDFFIYVGALHQRKNISSLLKAFDKYKKTYNSDIKLVIVGRKFWPHKEMEDSYNNMDHKNEVVFTGRLADTDLANTLASATALVYISYFEGFGIPLIEAMKCGVPVITSNKSSLPEVAGEAGMIVDPFDINGIADAMNKIAKDNNLRENLIEKAQIQLNKFSWPKSASLLWESIEKTIKN